MMRGVAPVALRSASGTGARSVLVVVVVTLEHWGSARDVLVAALEASESAGEVLVVVSDGVLAGKVAGVGTVGRGPAAVAVGLKKSWRVAWRAFFFGVAGGGRGGEDGPRWGVNSYVYHDIPVYHMCFGRKRSGYEKSK